MVNFNQLEKEIIEKISKIDIESNDLFSKFLQDQYFTTSRNEILLIKHDTKDVVFYVKPEVYADDKKRPKAIKELWILISLMEYLIEKRYVLNIPIENKSGLDIIFSEFNSPEVLPENCLRLNKNGDYLKTSNPEVIYNSQNEIIFKGFLLNDIYSNISNNLLNIIFPTTELQELVKHNFKSLEHRKYKTQLTLTWIGIIISAIIGGYSIFSDMQESKKSNPFKDKVLQKFDNLIEEIKDNNKIKDTLLIKQNANTTIPKSTNKKN